MTAPGGPGAEHRSETRLEPAIERLDRATSWVELPVRRLAGPAVLDPLPHAGTISVFLLGVVTVTGLYLTLFFEFGHQASYQAVASMEAHAIQRVVRAGHRYASAALVVTSLVHGWRIFTARRFVGGRRPWRWATGVAAVVTVWLAGVTGYWLVWDSRAQALNEAVVALLGGTGAGARFAIDHLGVVGGRSGSGFLLLVWTVHLALTAVVGAFVWRHLRRTRQPWLPPPLWMGLMGGALLVVSLLVPVGMLAPARPDRLIGEVPLDPFVLFLLPPLLSPWAWAVLAGGAAALTLALALPRLLRRGAPAPVVIDEGRCTGCELCVLDCPYEALTMVPRPAAGSTGGSEPAGSGPTGGDGPAGSGPTGGEPTGGGGQPYPAPLAVVDPGRCVACGICLGSCAFDAIELPGWEPVDVPAAGPDGRSLVVTCDRHLRTAEVQRRAAIGDVEIRGVSCAGALAPGTMRRLSEHGVAELHLIGCAPNDCRYGIGNRLADERLAGDRRPHPAPRDARRIAQDWVPTDRFERALDAPGSHHPASGRWAPGDRPRRETVVGAAVVVAATALGVALATRAPFGGADQQASLRLVVDHRSGRALALAPDGGPVGAIASVEIDVGATTVRAENPGSGPDWTAVLDLEPAPGAGPVTGPLAVRIVDDAGRRVTGEVPGPAADRSTTGAGGDRRGAEPGVRVVVDLRDVPDPPTVADGRRIFDSRQGGCSVCHSVEPGRDGVGPSLAGVASDAGGRVEGLDAEQYLRQSILLPDQYVLDGWPAGQMLPIYRDRLSAEELDAVIAYLLTLERRGDQGEGS